MDSDHDILITLVANVSANHATMLDKFGLLQADISDVKTGSNATLMEHERRLRIIEEMVVRLDPVAASKRADLTFEWMQETKRDQRRDQLKRNAIAGAIGIAANISVSVLTNLGLIPIKH